MKGKNPLLRAARTNAVLAANQRICMEKNTHRAQDPVNAE